MNMHFPRRLLRQRFMHTREERLDEPLLFLRSHLPATSNHLHEFGMPRFGLPHDANDDHQ